MFSKDGSTIIKCPDAKEPFYSIPYGVTSIQDCAFSRCSKLISITIPESVKTIGENSFVYCSNLRYITIPNSVTRIDADAFSGCKSLKTITIPGSVSWIRDRTFSFCSSLTDVYICNGVKGIGLWAFQDCSNLETIYFPRSVREIQNSAFYNCSNLKTIIIPDSVTGPWGSQFGNIAEDYMVYTFPDSYASSYFESTHVNIIDTSGIMTFENIAPYSVHIGTPHEIQYYYDESSTDILFSSDDPDIISIDQNGQMIAHDSGEAIITISAGNDSKTVSVIATGHSYGDWFITEPTCVESGFKIKTCETCGEPIIEEISALGHMWNEEPTIDKAATCTEEGSQSIHCNICDATKDVEAIPAIGHQWNTTYTIDVPATESAPGSQSIHCSVCGVVKDGSTQTIAQLPPSEIIDLPTVKISKPAAGKKKVTVKWKKVSKKNLKKISGIEIQVATDPNFTNIVKTATAGKKKTSKAIKGLQPKTTYYVRIRAYAAGNHYSVWKSKSAKVK